MRGPPGWSRVPLCFISSGPQADGRGGLGGGLGGPLLLS